MSGGGALGLGRSTSRQSSESQSSSYGYSGSTSSDISQSISDAVSGGTSQSTQDIAFRDLYEQLYGGAGQAAGSALARAPELAGTARMLFGSGGQLLDSLQDNAATDYLNERLTGENPLLQQQIDLLREDTGRLFREEFNPAITSTAVAGGALGGGRQGVAQGMAMDSAAREFTRGATALRSADLTARDAAAATALSGTLQAASTGLSSLPLLMDLASSEATTELGIFSNLAAIMGGPTTLTQAGSQDFSRSNSRAVSEAFARSFGENRSNATSRSSGRSDAWNFSASGYGGFGGGGMSGG